MAPPSTASITQTLGQCGCDPQTCMRPSDTTNGQLCAVLFKEVFGSREQNLNKAVYTTATVAYG